MSPERVYAALLALYPESFRHEYGDAMIEAFRDLSRARRRTRPAFWMFVVTDLCRSVGRTQLDACRSGARRFVLPWIVACTLGILVSGLVAGGLTWCFSYLYHPYLEGSSLGLLIAGLSGDAIGPVGRGVVLGVFVAAGQWLALRRRLHRAGWWILATAVAVPTGALSVSAATQRTFAGMNPLAGHLLARTDQADTVETVVRTLGRPAAWPEFLLACAVMATSGLVIGALTARSVREFHAD